MRILLVLATMGLLAVTLYYGVISKDPLPDHRILQGKNDLFLHFVAFAALSIPVRLLWNTWVALAALICCAGAVEAVQIFQPGRTAAFDDFIASIIGVAAGAAFVALLRLGYYRNPNTIHK